MIITIPQPQGLNDRNIMDISTRSYSIQELNILNVCRLYFDVIFLLDISSISGKEIIQGSFSSDKEQIPESNLSWQNQKILDKKTWKIWNRVIHNIFCTLFRSNVLKRETNWAIGY